jgi:hypothetical protein
MAPAVCMRGAEQGAEWRMQCVGGVRGVPLCGTRYASAQVQVQTWRGSESSHGRDSAAITSCRRFIEPRRHLRPSRV